MRWLLLTCEENDNFVQRDAKQDPDVQDRGYRVDCDAMANWRCCRTR
jgi:hypothetical protein